MVGFAEQTFEDGREEREERGSRTVLYQRPLKAATASVLNHVKDRTCADSVERFLWSAVVKCFISQFEQLGTHRWTVNIEKSLLTVYKETVAELTDLPRAKFFSTKIPLIQEFTEQRIELAEEDCAWLLLGSYVSILKATGLTDRLQVDEIIHELFLRYSTIKTPSQFGIVCWVDDDNPIKLELRLLPKTKQQEFEQYISTRREENT